MKTGAIISAILCLLFFAPCSAKAQDSLRKNNQVYAEFFGNNFKDHNSTASYDGGLVSIDYCRKMFFRSNCFEVSIGLGPLKAEGYDSVRNETYPITIVNIPCGFLWRRNYKRNGFWCGVFCTAAVGKLTYSHTESNYPWGGAHTVIYEHMFTPQVSPNLTYQFQSKLEHFFCRISYTPKILPSIFSTNYGDGYPLYPLWFGISIGGAW